MRDMAELELALALVRNERDDLKDVVAAYNHEAVRIAERDRVLHQVVADYDRRREGRWGRFLLWLLNRTT